MLSLCVTVMSQTVSPSVTIPALAAATFTAHMKVHGAATIISIQAAAVPALPGQGVRYSNRPQKGRVINLSLEI